jgi:outer membrane protein assembly factor BamB
VRTAGIFISAILLSGVCFAQPALVLSAEGGPPTTGVFVSGSGFPASTTVDIYFDTTELALAGTNGTGSFPGIKIRVPASALPGTHWITAAVANVTGDTAQAPFHVRTNWSQFRFTTNHSGLNPHENVLSRTTVGDLGLRWSYSTVATASSSPAVANGVVYAGAQEDFNVHALNATTGALLWQFTTGGYVNSSPAVVNKAVYVGSYDGNLYALYAATGAVLWQFTTGGLVDSSPW